MGRLANEGELKSKRERRRRASKKEARRIWEQRGLKLEARCAELTANGIRWGAHPTKECIQWDGR